MFIELQHVNYIIIYLGAYKISIKMRIFQKTCDEYTYPSA